MHTQTIIGSLIGAALIHLLFVACGSSGSQLDGAASADAQTTPVCTTWEVQGFPPELLRTLRVTEISGGRESEQPLRFFDAFQLEAGWEPFGGSVHEGVLARRCVR